MKKKPIGVYTLSNTGSILVHEIDHGEDKVQISLNNGKKEWTYITMHENKLGFYWGVMFIPFEHVLRV